ADQRRILGLLFFPLAQRGAALEDTQVVDEQLAVQMIDLVLEAPGEEVGALDFERLPVAVERADDDACGAVDVAVYLGDRETALFSPCRAFLEEYLGVDEGDRLRRRLVP